MPKPLRCYGGRIDLGTRRQYFTSERKAPCPIACTVMENESAVATPAPRLSIQNWVISTVLSPGSWVLRAGASKYSNHRISSKRPGNLRTLRHLDCWPTTNRFEHRPMHCTLEGCARHVLTVRGGTDGIQTVIAIRSDSGGLGAGSRRLTKAETGTCSKPVSIRGQ